MNREEVDHGSQGKEVEVKEESQEGCCEKEDRRESLRAEEKIPGKEKEGCTEESTGEKEIRAEEAGAAETRPETGAAKTRPKAGTAETRSEAGRAKARARSSSASRIRTARLSEPDHLSPVQPTGGKRQSG